MECKNWVLVPFSPVHRQRKFSAVFGVGALSVRGVETFMRDYSLAQVFTGIAGLVALIMAAATVIIWLTRGQPVRNMPAAEPR